MRNVGKVLGSKEQAVPLIIGKDTVYVHTNIRKIASARYDDEENILYDDLYEYDEIQYTIEEWSIEALKENEALKEQITGLQLAICEVFEYVDSIIDAGVGA